MRRNWGSMLALRRQSQSTQKVLVLGRSCIGRELAGRSRERHRYSCKGRELAGNRHGHRERGPNRNSLRVRGHSHIERGLARRGGHSKRSRERSTHSRLRLDRSRERGRRSQTSSWRWSQGRNLRHQHIHHLLSKSVHIWITSHGRDVWPRVTRDIVSS